MTDRLTLYCFACAGSSAAPFYRWRRLAPAWLRIEPIERPGRGPRLHEPHLRGFEETARLLTGEIAAGLAPNYALFGHSLGALLAFGCARELRRRGAPPPRALALAAAAAPSRRKDARFAALRTDADLIATLRRLGGTPEDVFADPELSRIALDAAAADFAVVADFRHAAKEAPFDFPLLVFGGREDDVEEEALRAWREETRGPFGCELMEGGHFFLREREEEFVAALAARLKAALAGATIGADR
jgi:surfactin synthase thioesterase subunit